MAADYSSIGPLDATAQKEGISLLGYVILDAIAAIAGLYIVGLIANALIS